MVWLFDCAEYLRIPESSTRPTSPWMPFPALISALSEFLPPTHIRLMAKYHRDLKVSNLVALSLYFNNF